MNFYTFWWCLSGPPVQCQDTLNRVYLIAHIHHQALVRSQRKVQIITVTIMPLICSYALSANNGFSALECTRLFVTAIDWAAANLATAIADASGYVKTKGPITQVAGIQASLPRVHYAVFRFYFIFSVYFFSHLWHSEESLLCSCWPDGRVVTSPGCCHAVLHIMFLLWGDSALPLPRPPPPPLLQILSHGCRSITLPSVSPLRWMITVPSS